MLHEGSVWCNILINIKLCFVKQPWAAMWSWWQSTRFATPRAMLDTFCFKSTHLGLLLACKGDVWVMEDSPCLSNSRRMWEEADPDATAEVYQRTSVTKWDSVPWGNYDLVFSDDPIIPPEIIKAYPKVLWCHGIGEHTGGGIWKARGEYDLFWDHTLASPKTVEGLPQAISLPFTINAQIMRELIRPANEPAIFLPMRAVCPHGSLRAEKIPKTLADLPVRHAGVWNLRQTYRAILNGVAKSSMQRFRNLGSCRYLLNVRPGGEIGQPIIEAAALGLIVVSTQELYSTVVHPFCQTHSVDDGIRMIRQLEASPSTRRRILEYQGRVLQRQFWDEPLTNLRRALDIKRERTI